MNICEGETQELVQIQIHPGEEDTLPVLLEEGFIPGSHITVLKRYPKQGKWILLLNHSVQVAIEDKLANRLITSPLNTNAN